MLEAERMADVGGLHGCLLRGYFILEGTRTRCIVELELKRRCGSPIYRAIRKLAIAR